MDTFRLLTRGSGLRSKAPVCDLSQNTIEAVDQQPSSLNTKGTKRKREADLADTTYLEPEQIRSLHKAHKIRIVDFQSLQKSGEHESRKVQKEASRLLPQPLQKFSALRKYNVNHALLSNISDQGYREPTEVQLATIPMLMDGSEKEPHLLTVAPTGSGKTLAFLIPLINKTATRHQQRSESKADQEVTTIILAPTKELVTQIVNEGRKLAANTGVRVTAFKKGMRLHSTIILDDASDSETEVVDSAATLVKADILVATPLSLKHAITDSSSGDVLALPSIRNLVLDEADVLLDPLFRDQAVSIWTACSNPSVRIQLWSATIGSSIEEFAMSQLTTLDTAKDTPVVRCIIGLKDSSLPNISHNLIYASTEAGKLTGLRNIIRPPPSTAKPIRPPFLIFTQTITRATALHSELQYDIPSPDPTVPRIAVLHSNLSSSAREKIMHNYRLGKIWILITTDLLSRGIDFRGVNAVVNYDIPTTTASYVHRAGRTGRANKDGACITLYTREDVMYLKPIANIIQKSQGDAGVPRWLMDALPALSKNARKDLKKRGVEVRRAVKQSDEKDDKRKKLRNTIGTKSGYEKKAENRRQGMIEGSRRRIRKKQEEARDEEDEQDEYEDFGGFD